MSSRTTLHVTAERRARRRRIAASLRCARCGSPWTLRLVAHPAGAVVACTRCGAAHGTAAVPRETVVALGR
jgi:DNA-directed RNA polymerase subunit RPC12/RpoP